nr:DEAD/DEAH box helicase family protein [Natrinema gari]
MVNSAVKDDYLETSLRDANTDDHLLVADECHRYTGDVHSRVLEYPNSATLGLSATVRYSTTQTDFRTSSKHEVLNRPSHSAKGDDRVSQRTSGVG